MRIKTRCFFDAAHRLVGHEGNCERIHGHTWVVDISINSLELDKVGRVVDFGDLKKIINHFDHRLILKECSSNMELTKSIPHDWVRWTNFNPTCEELAKYFKRRITAEFTLSESDVTIKVFESLKPESYSFSEV